MKKTLAQGSQAVRRRGPGKPFVKGGDPRRNPGGVPPDEKELALILRARGPELAAALLKAAVKGNVAAIKEAFDRAYGRSKERIEVSGPNGSAISITTDLLRALPPEKLEQLEAIMKSAAPDEPPHPR